MSERIAPSRLPRFVEAPAGRVRVVQARKPRDSDGKVCWGTYDHAMRAIVIERALVLRQKWSVMYHEQAHVALYDAGVSNLLSEDLHEAVCDAFASARMRERFG